MNRRKKALKKKKKLSLVKQSVHGKIGTLLWQMISKFAEVHRFNSKINYIK